MSDHGLDERTCSICGRRLPAGAAAAVRRCSQRCRRARLGSVERALEAQILASLAAVARGVTICPSVVAQAIFGPTGLQQPQMERTRQAARRLVAAGQVQIVQAGKVVDPSTARGPIRLRRR